jgi:hypothetical protein
MTMRATGLISGFRCSSNTACFGFVENKGRREICAPCSIVGLKISKPVSTDTITRHNQRMSALGKPQRSAGWRGQGPVRAVPVQAGKVCNHRASPNRHLSSIPKNGCDSDNMQCAGRATAHREQLVDGKIR